MCVKTYRPLYLMSLVLDQHQFLDAQIYASVLSNISSMKLQHQRRDDLVDVRLCPYFFNHLFCLVCFT